jgi:hypothetical protein
MVFDGDNFLPEEKDGLDTSTMATHLKYKYSNTFETKISPTVSIYSCPDYENYCTLVASGRLEKVNGDHDYSVFYEEKRLSSRHVEL